MTLTERFRHVKVSFAFCRFSKMSIGLSLGVKNTTTLSPSEYYWQIT